jgi:hypothetical protein
VKRWLLTVVLGVVFGLGSGALPAFAEPNDGAVGGRVLNQTAGGAATAGTPVVLVLFGRKEQAPIGQKTTQTDSDGRYSFSGLDRDPNIVYFTLARFQEVNYPTDQPFQLQDQPSAESDIAVYDTTTADDAIKLESLNLLVTGTDKGIVQCMEMGALVNSGDRTFVTANPQDQAMARAIKFALPSGALNVQMQTGFSNQEVIPGVGGVQVTSPIPPGRHQFALSFQLPYAGSNADVSLQVPYPAGSYTVYLPNSSMTLDGSPLKPGQPAQMGGQTYVPFSASNVPKATMIGGRITGLGATGGLLPDQLTFISLAVVLFVLGGGVVVFGRRLGNGPAPRPRYAPGADSEQERLELVVRLAVLDERFAAGEVSQRDYSAERERGKQRLRELALARRPARPAPSEG